MTAIGFPALLQRFFTDRLVRQLGASPHTVAGYRDTFRLLLGYVSAHVGKGPSALQLEDLDVALLGRFLDHLEQDRSNSARTRNVRLAAIHAFFRYVSFVEPAQAHLCQRVLAVPTKRYDRKPVEFLSEAETVALVGAVATDTWIGRRDHALLTVALQTGLRNSEITGLLRQDVEFGAGAHVRCLGKGRKMRCTPLRPDVAKTLAAWFAEIPGAPGAHVFPRSRGGRLSADALQHLVARHVAAAGRTCPTLVEKTVTPHTLRHSAAMSLLCHGVDLTVIALWLGHESTETTQAYLHADMALKERALAHSTSSGTVPERFHPTDALLAFLENL